MTSFERWFLEQGRSKREITDDVVWSNPIPVSESSMKPELPDGLYRDTRTNRIMATCRCCGGSYEWDVGPEEFDWSMSYCGGSPRCLP